MLTVVLWNPANPHRAMTTFHHGNKPLDQLAVNDGDSIAETCKDRGVTITAYMEAFPGCCRPDDWVKGDPLPSSWDIPILEICLPGSDDRRRELAAMLGEDLTFLHYERGVGFRNDPQHYAA